MKPVKTASRWDLLTPGDQWYMGWFCERVRVRLRVEAREMDEEQKRSSDEHWGRCKGETKW